MGAFGSRRLLLVPTLFHIWNCVHTSPGANECFVDTLTAGGEPDATSHPFQHLLLQAALALLPKDMQTTLTPIYSEEYPFICPRCYEAVVQPTRVFVGEALLHNEFRRAALGLCGVAEAVDLPSQRRFVLVRRTRFSRAWANVDSLLRGLLD